MDLGLDDEQEQLVASFTTLFAKESSSERVRAAEPAGFDPLLWRALLDVGAVTMAVDEDHGGWGATLADLALVAEQVGRATASAPLIETQVAARLLSAIGSDEATAALGDVLGHERVVTVALHPPAGGVARMVPAGAVCDACIVLDGERLLLVPVDDRRRRPVANLASAPLADLDVPTSISPVGLTWSTWRSGPGVAERFEAAMDEWLVLTASALVGMGAAALDLASEYARERSAFGSPIGAFQGVAHPLADDATNLDGARLLVQKAAWSIDRGSARGRELAAMAFAFASESAEAATYDGVHVHGGYGFMLEYDVQLLYRRVRGWARVWGDAAAGYVRAADARYANGGEVSVDFEWDADTEALREEVRAFLAEHLTDELEHRLYTTGVSHDDGFAREMGRRGWIAPEWPGEDGSPALGPAAVHVLTEELTRADAPIYAVSTSMMVARVIAASGTDELRSEVIPGVVRGEVTIALGMSEPEAGSDVAAVQTRARREGDGWIIDGQKMFTTNGHITDYVFLLARTDPTSSRHRGLTTFLVPLDLDGIEVQAVYTMSGERTNITYYGDVFLDDRWRIGEVDGGWRTLMLALQDEHSAPFSPHLDRLLGEVEAWAVEERADGRAPIQDPARPRPARSGCHRPRGGRAARGAHDVAGVAG